MHGARHASGASRALPAKRAFPRRNRLPGRAGARAVSLSSCPAARHTPRAAFPSPLLTERRGAPAQRPGRRCLSHPQREVKWRVATDWLKLRDEYLRSPDGLKPLAERHGIGYGELKRRAAKEGWAARKRAMKKRDAPVPGAQAAAPPATNADRRAQLMAIGDRLTAQLARAAGDLDKRAVQHKRRTKETTYGDEQNRGKPVEETVEEHVSVEVVEVPVDSMGLQRLSSALKILREVTLAGSDDEQSLRKVEELMRKLDEDAGKEPG